MPTQPLQLRQFGGPEVTTCTNCSRIYANGNPHCRWCGIPTNQEVCHNQPCPAPATHLLEDVKDNYRAPWCWQCPPPEVIGQLRELVERVHAPLAA